MLGDGSLIATVSNELYNLFFHNKNFWGDFGWWIQIIGGMGTFVTLIVFLLQLKIDRDKWKKDEIQMICNTCNAILKEINNHKNTFESSTDPIIGDEINYIERILNTDAYDSIIQSGLFSQFEEDTQTALSNLYQRIRLRNESLKHLNKLGDMNILIPNSPSKMNELTERSQYYQRTVTLWEIEIRGLLYGVEVLVRKELDELSST